MLRLLLIGILFPFFVSAQCPDCGNGVINAGETAVNCPADVSQSATCVSPCSQPSPFEATVGIRTSYDFSGTTTYGAASLPAGWSFAGAPTPTTAGALPAADVFGAKAGLVQPNCSGGCTGTNFFCIGNLANNVIVGANGSSGKLGANFDGRANISQNLSYAVLRGQNNPTLVSETFNFSGVEGFKIQFWLNASETSCGQNNGWGSCVGNTAFLDFSSNGGTTWTQVMQMNNSSSAIDMCTNNSTNTFWIQEGTWSRVCLTVFKTSNSPGNFYTAANGTTAASGIMVNSSFFTNNFKFRIRYSQTASCTTATATNPGRYLAIDYPVITSGNQMIPCGISFSNMCGYGQDNNDDGVGNSVSTTTTTVFGTTRRSVNQAERGVEIFHSQAANYSAANITGSSLPSNFDLCNAEGSDQQCIDWRTNNNGYFVVYECITDWEANNSINVNYYKNTSPISFALTKVTTAGKTATIGWRHSGSRFVNCSSGDLNAGCNGYLFQSQSLPPQMIRAFYGLASNSTGQSWSYYGSTSCSNYFNGPFFAPIAVPDTVTGAGNYFTCNPAGDLVLTSLVDYCTTSGFTGNSTVSISGPSGYTDVFNAGDSSTVAIVTPGDYTLTANTPSTPAQCVDCSRSECITIMQADIDNCATALPVILTSFTGSENMGKHQLNWTTASEIHADYFSLERSLNGQNFQPIGKVKCKGGIGQETTYEWMETTPDFRPAYYRLKQFDTDGKQRLSETIWLLRSASDLVVIPNPAKEHIQLNCNKEVWVKLINPLGKIVLEQSLKPNEAINIEKLPVGWYTVLVANDQGETQMAYFVH